MNDVFAEYMVQMALMGMAVERIACELYTLMTEEIGEISETFDADVVGESTSRTR